MQHVLAAIAFGLLAALQGSVPSAGIDEFARSELKASGLPGVAYATVDHGEIRSGAAGEVLIGSGEAVTPDTPFLIGSISKSMTAMAIVKLSEAGKLELDDPVSAHLAAFAGQPSGAITLRQLLSHTSGYSTLQGNSTGTGRAGSSTTLSAKVDEMALWTPAYQPGTRWDYSNANYIILGAVIEAVSGKDFAGYIETEILAPAGMTGSFVADGEFHDGMAVGHWPWFGTKRPIKRVRTSRLTAPAGGVIASANDLARYAAIMTNGEDDIISAASKAMMLQPANPQSPLYGLGWALDPAGGTVYHTGTTPGVDTALTLDPDAQKGVVVLVNAGGGMGFGETRNLIVGIGSLGLGVDYTPDRSGWGRQILFLIFVLMPVLFVIGMVQAVVQRDGLRAKSGPFGAFSLWFPLLMTLVLAWVSTYLIPHLFGVSLGTLRLYQPDWVIAMTATAVTGVIWAVFRLAVYYSASRPGT